MNIKRRQQVVLYKKFILEKDYSVQQIASKLEKSCSWLYDRLEGRTELSGDDLRLIAKATDDDEIYNLLLINTDRQVCRSFDPEIDYSGKDFQKEVTDNLESLADVSRSLKEAMIDNILDQPELKKLQGLAKKNAKEAQDIFHLIKSKISS